ncbi:enoyl-CoA hydratase-related protein [Streptomyces sp. NPDC003038]|uniref:enoyl-CoA hydratase-related protein n=1 Tax=unclassified Streptomyces TaxID=2593676 RepID=UPI0033B76A73
MVARQCDGVLVITLNRPHVRNAVNQALADALDHALTLLETDPGLNVGVLTGAGGHFCPGAGASNAPSDGS